MPLVVQRILTPSNVPNLFGPGKPGFGDDPNPLLATAFDASWCNGVQESLVRTVEAAGLIPDGANFDQFTDAILSFPFDSPTVATLLTMLDGSFLVLEDQSVMIVSGDGGNGGSRIEIKAPDGKLMSEIGAIVELLSDVTIGDSNLQTLTVNAVTQLQSNVTLASTQTMTLAGTAQVAGGATSAVTAGTISQTTSNFADSGTSLPPAVRDHRWLDTIKAVRMPDGGAGTVRAVAIPAVGSDPLFTTAAAIADTTAQATIRAFEAEPLIVTVKFGYRHTAAAATGLMNTRLEFQGPTDEEEFIEQWVLESSVGWLPFSQDYIWTPTDTFITPGTRNYTILVRAGSNLGANLELRNVTIQVRSAFQA